jgi:hypothetical protein
MVDYSSSGGKDWNQSSGWSAPLSPKAQGRYWNWLDKRTGGKLGEFAQTGTQATGYQGVANPGQYFGQNVLYQGPTDDVIRQLGGMGATRLNALDKQYKQRADETNSDAGMTLLQRQRTNQLSDQDLAGQRDAINKETEAALAEAAFMRADKDMQGRLNQAGQSQALAQFLQGEGDRGYAADVANALLPGQDFANLSDIYAKGKGQRQQNQSTGSGKQGSEGIGL